MRSTKHSPRDADWLTEGGRRVLVPLCGKSRDLMWLEARGLDVVGVELSPLACEAVFAEAGRTPTVTERGALRVYRDGRLTVICGDLFDVGPEDVGAIGAVWDRAALVALPPPMRDRYVPHLRGLCVSGARVLLIALVYDGNKQGPPHSIPESEVRRHYAGADVQLAVRRDLSAEIRPHWAEAGMTWLHAEDWHITLP